MQVKNTTEAKLPFLIIHVISTISLLMLTLIIMLRLCLSGFSTIKLPLPTPPPAWPPFPYCRIPEGLLCTTTFKTSGSTEMIWIFLHGRFDYPHQLHLFNHIVISQYGPMDTDFILLVTVNTLLLSSCSGWLFATPVDCSTQTSALHHLLEFHYLLCCSDCSAFLLPSLAPCSLGILSSWVLWARPYFLSL